ncbi:MAG TPA: riboflavin synthase [Bacteroidia bacterium]|jgi:riboflavin synthase|nr:riboflavin synthase [Bacteroidia bacterium]HRG53635.1 riboflavin synthase [Bacteroidia bacterium]
MFSGIIESIGKVVDLKKEKGNLHISVQSSFTNELKIDQSIAHNGACLTVVSIHDEVYVVTAIDETLQKTNLGTLKMNDLINLERCMKLGDRLDGHIVQGHVDQIATCVSVEEANGSWIYTFNYDSKTNNITVEKGSICVNGVSLTVVNSQDAAFSVCIIPYTYEHTNFKHIQQGSVVNLEFDILGKYIHKLMKR